MFGFYSQVTPTALEFLGSIKMGANATTSAVLTIPAREQLFIMVVVAGYGGGDRVSLVFNGDTANNYWDRHLASAAGASTFGNSQNANQGLIRLAANASTAGRIISVFVKNIAAASKPVVIHTATATGTAGTVGEIDIGAGEWVNTVSQITTIQLKTAGGQNLLAGTEFSVYGVNP